MLDYKFEKLLQDFIVKNKPEGSLDIHISCDINGTVKITENYREMLMLEIQDIIDDLRDEVENLTDQLYASSKAACED